MKIAVIGAGAAGCFCAIELKRRMPSASVEVFEAGPKSLAKVAITGGGRCNLTNSFEGISSLSEAYPRGDKLMKRLFRSFDNNDTWSWFENEGVRLVLQSDHCVFPASQNAMEIVGTLLARMRQEGVVLRTNHKVTRIFSRPEGGYTLSTELSGRQSLRQAQRPVCSAPELVEGPMSQNLQRQNDHEYSADIVVVTTGGSPKLSGLGMLDSLSLEIIPPVPSLFTFNLPADPVRELMGTVVEIASVSLSGTKFKADGPLLITHWGMSGPAILKLSSYAARYLAENEYSATLSVNWLGDSDEQDIRARIMSVSKQNSQKLILNTHPSELPSRLWVYLISKSGIREDSRWAELGSKGMNRLVNTLINDEYRIRGKSRFKEEFVTCGGVALSNINLSTLECKTHPGLYFAGEVLDVDAITGGFNLQAAWTTGYIAARSISAFGDPLGHSAF